MKENLKYSVLLLFSVTYFNTIWAQNSESGHQKIRFDKQEIIDRVSANPDFDLHAFPIYNYVVDTALISPVRIGDSIPEQVWNLPLTIVHQRNGIDTLILDSFSSTNLLVVDFWATWCSPCVASMDKWEGVLRAYPGQITLLGVHMDYDYKALPFLKRRNWMSSSVIGLNAYVLNRYFFPEGKAVGFVALIKDGRLIALKRASEELSMDELSGLLGIVDKTDL